MLTAIVLAAGNGVGDSLKDPNLAHDTIVWVAKILVTLVGLAIIGLALSKPKWGTVFSKVAIVAVGCAVIAGPWLYDLGSNLSTKL
jgi:uncharacterized membrane protein YccC